MKGINTIIPESIDVKEAKKSQSGKWYYSYGIKADGDWHNGVLYEKSHADALTKRGEAEHIEEIELYFYEEEYKGEMKKKCRTVTTKDWENDEIIKRIEALEEKVHILENPGSSLAGEQSEHPNDEIHSDSEPTEEKQMDDLPF